MARVNPATIQAVLDADGGVTHDVIDIYLPIKGAEQQIVWHWSDATIRVNGIINLNFDVVNDVDYLGVVTQQPRIKHTEGKSTDDADFEIENISLIYSGLLHEQDRTFDGAECVISRAFYIESTGLYTIGNGVGYQGGGNAELFRGFIASYRPTDRTIKFKATNDMTSKGRRIASRVMSDNCAAVFNKNGTKAASADLCGWQVAQGVDAGASQTSCDKTFHGANGCNAHRNGHRFAGYGIIEDNATEEIISTGSPGGGVGVGPGGGGNGWDPSSRLMPPDRDYRSPRSHYLIH